MGAPFSCMLRIRPVLIRVSGEREQMTNIIEEDDYTLEQGEKSAVAHFPEGPLVITAVEKAARQKFRYILHFGSYKLSVHEDVLVKYMLTTGSTFTKQELTEIILADEQQRAYHHALRYLGSKPRTSKEITERLIQKEIGQEVIDQILQRLQQEGLLNDALYAKKWARERVVSQKKGKAWVSQELRQKGVHKSLIAEALEEVDEDMELQSALLIGRKKWNQTKGEIMDRKRKTGAYLMRRGFSGTHARMVINRVMKEEELSGYDEEEEWLE